MRTIPTATNSRAETNRSADSSQTYGVSGTRHHNPHHKERQRQPGHENGWTKPVS